MEHETKTSELIRFGYVHHYQRRYKMELEGFDNWLTNAPDPIEVNTSTVFYMFGRSRDDGCVAYVMIVRLDLKAYDNIISYQTDTDITGYFIIEGKLIFVEFNEVVIYRYDAREIGNHQFQNLCKFACEGEGLSRYIFGMQPKYNRKTLYEDIKDYV